MEYNYIKIGERIRNERKKLGVSQGKLLDNIRDKGKPTFGRNTLSSLENGDKDAFQAVNVAQLMALCEEFDCSIGYLLGEYEAHNYDNEFICQKTGLWEENIQKLTHYGILFINAVISSEYFENLSSDFLTLVQSQSKWKRQVNLSGNKISDFDLFVKERIIGGTQYSAYNMAIQFGNFVNDYLISDSKESLVSKKIDKLISDLRSGKDGVLFSRKKDKSLGLGLYVK